METCLGDETERQSRIYFKRLKGGGVVGGVGRQAGYDLMISFIIFDIFSGDSLPLAFFLYGCSH
jgi:hypothetical protein